MNDAFYNPENPILAPGIMFKDFQEFMQACRDWSVISKREVMFDPNDQRRVKCICKTDECSFFIWSGKVKIKKWKKSNSESRPVEIKSHDFSHTCNIVNKNFHFTPKWIFNQHIPELVENPSISVADLQAILKNIYGYNVHETKAWRVRDLARKAAAETMKNEFLSSSNELQLGPITPDQFKGQASDESDLETPIARHMQSSEDTLKRAEADSQQNEEQSGLVLDMSKLQEKHSPDKADAEESNTQQKKRRRKKHQPTVVPKTPQQHSSKKTIGEREYVRRNKVGEPPGTPSDKVNDMTSHEGQLPFSREIQRGKRKFIRRNQVYKPTPNPDEEGTVDPPKISHPRRSCRKSLNCDLESKLSDENSSHWPFSTVEDLHENQSHSSIHLGKGIEATTEKTELGTVYEMSNRNEISRGERKIIFSDEMQDKQASFLEINRQASNCRSSAFLILETPERALKKRHPVRTDESELYSTDVKRARTQGMHAIYKKKRTEKRHLRKGKGHLSTASYTKPFACETNSLSLSQCNIGLLQATASTNDKTNNIKGNPELVPAFVEIRRLREETSKCISKVHDLASPPLKIYKHFPTHPEATLSGETWGLRKKRSKCISKVHDLASQLIEICKHFPTPPVKEAALSEFGERDENLDQPNTCMETLLADITYQNKFHAEKTRVIYQGDGSSVPFVGSSPRKRQLPKVDIDDETARVLKLLLQDINSEGIDDTDEKNTWWVGERGLFHGRVDSFVAWMRLVQGDRRFSPWKGSVVDSVVGVFLTQNVSDHLSSSAFMSLAARFPLKPKAPMEKHEERTGIITQEPEVSALDPANTFGWHDDQSTQPTLGKAVCSSESSENSTNCTSSTEKSTSQQPGSTESLCVHHESTMYGSTTANAAASFSGDPDDLLPSQHSLLSPQNSVNFPVVQTSEITQSINFSGSTSFLKLLQMVAGTSKSHGVQDQKSENILPEMDVHGQLKHVACHSHFGKDEENHKVDTATIDDSVVNIAQQIQIEESNYNMQQVAEAPTFSEAIVFIREVSLVVDSCKSEDTTLRLNSNNDRNHAGITHWTKQMTILKQKTNAPEKRNRIFTGTL